MLLRLLYEGPVASTAESYTRRIAFSRMTAGIAAVLFVLMTAVVTWSVLDIHPLGDVPALLAVVVGAVQVIGGLVALGNLAFLAMSLHAWRRLSRDLAALGGRFGGTA